MPVMASKLSFSHASDDAVLKAMGERLARARLERNRTQAALAKEAGISSRTIARAEAGESIQLAKWVRLLRALDLIDGLDAVLPPPTPGPVALWRGGGRTRQRASSPRRPRGDSPWTWGDEGTDQP